MFTDKRQWRSLDTGFKIPYHAIVDDAQLEHLSAISSTSSSSSSSSFGTSIPQRFIFNATKTSQPKKPRQNRLSELPLFAALRKRKAQQSLKTLYGPLSIVSSTSSGSMVYKSCSPQNGQLHAIKVFRFRYTYETHREYCLNISNEIYIATSLKHENIIRMVDVLEENGRLYQVMEYCPYDLFTVFEKLSPTDSQVKQYFVELVHGVAYLHHRGVAHRDLKLENLCIDQQGHLKIIDFEFATLFRSSSNSKETHVTGVFGSNTYIAPEVWARDSYDPSKDDVWAVGILFVGMITRKFPWQRAIPDDPSFRLFLESWESIRLFDYCPPESIPLLKRLLEVEPDHRATIQDILCDPWFQSLEAEVQSQASGCSPVQPCL